MATKLIDKVRIEESVEKEETNKPERKNQALHSISSRDSSKDKQISAKVNGNVYAMFSEINKAQGISNNSALNMIITRYVRENKGILAEDY